MATQLDYQPFERRTGERYRRVLALGKIFAEERERVCLVRDVSSGGLKIEMAEAPRQGSYVVVEMLGLTPCPARVAWHSGEQAGLAFIAPQQTDQMCRRGADDRGAIARSPRFSLVRCGELRVGGRTITAELANISVGGARLTNVAGVQPNQAATLILRDAPIPLSGHIRWASGGEAGFRFAPVLDYRTLTAILG